MADRLSTSNSNGFFDAQDDVLDDPPSPVDLRPPSMASSPDIAAQGRLPPGRDDPERIPVEAIMDIRVQDQIEDDAALARDLDAALAAEATDQQQQPASSASHNYYYNRRNNDNWSESDGWGPLPTGGGGGGGGATASSRPHAHPAPSRASPLGGGDIDDDVDWHVPTHVRPGPAPAAAASAAASGGGGGGWTSGGASRPSVSGQQHLLGWVPPGRPEMHGPSQGGGGGGGRDRRERGGAFMSDLDPVTAFPESEVQANQQKWRTAHKRNDFYREHPEVRDMTQQEAQEMRKQKNIKVLYCVGRDLPKPVLTFMQAGFNQTITDEIQKRNFIEPTPIQVQSWPVALSGRDMVGVAQTGSGKTLAYLLPCIAHCIAQPRLATGDGPIALILAPTQELARQIAQEARAFVYGGMRVIECIGGERTAQAQLTRGGEICVATLGKLCDMIKRGNFRANRLTYMVLDEADRLVDYDDSFHTQLKFILAGFRDDRQMIMVTATWPEKVQRIARSFCVTEPVLIYCDATDLKAPGNITQHVMLCDSERKDSILTGILEDLHRKYHQPKIIIFANTQRRCDILCERVKAAGYDAMSSHSGKTSEGRQYVMDQFRHDRTKILIAPGVASRGLDIQGVTAVILYDMPNHIDEYIHRIGRTGRAGNRGISYALFDSWDYSRRDDTNQLAKDLRTVLENSNQPVPSLLTECIAKEGNIDWKALPLPFSGQPLMEIEDAQRHLGVGRFGQLPTHGSVNKTFTMRSKHDRASYVGQGGATIKTIQGHTGAKISIPAEGSDDLEITVTGAPQAVERAIHHLKRIREGDRLPIAINNSTNTRQDTQTRIQTQQQQRQDNSAGVSAGPPRGFGRGIFANSNARERLPVDTMGLQQQQQQQQGENQGGMAREDERQRELEALRKLHDEDQQRIARVEAEKRELQEKLARRGASRERDDDRARDEVARGLNSGRPSIPLMGRESEILSPSGSPSPRNINRIPDPTGPGPADYPHGYNDGGRGNYSHNYSYNQCRDRDRDRDDRSSGVRGGGPFEGSSHRYGFMERRDDPEDDGSLVVPARTRGRRRGDRVERMSRLGEEEDDHYGYRGGQEEDRSQYSRYNKRDNDDGDMGRPRGRQLANDDRDEDSSGTYTRAPARGRGRHPRDEDDGYDSHYDRPRRRYD
ncbi:unnamed protein product [Vitrella brassicaformis CCMP3155]|uniref:RNA helicase n=1 Tax=Vitrella brassicaformis (strain CCMP3155) TaxID=1169540 RepID=A0A0G4F8E4_VITBC|nr:unnamed protein product [Vitrella brassicaformis CCMP3155]|eukprot:CEM08645.1 unnamed protein product [Vitrella brassicaformis CCMP3155]